MNCFRQTLVNGFEPLQDNLKSSVPLTSDKKQEGILAPFQFVSLRSGGRTSEGTHLCKGKGPWICKGKTHRRWPCSPGHSRRARACAHATPTRCRPAAAASTSPSCRAEPSAASSTSRTCQGKDVKNVNASIEQLPELFRIRCSTSALCAGAFVLMIDEQCEFQSVALVRGQCTVRYAVPLSFWSNSLDADLYTVARYTP